MSHLDICSTSYGRKEGQESNWQFDSQPLKVENRPDLGACRQSEAHRWKAFKESYKFALDLIQIGGLSKKLQAAKVPRVQTGTVLGQFRDKKPFGYGPRGVAQSILYGGRWWLPPNPGHGESSESKVAHGLS
jgi:hypothetical protein